MKYKISVMYEGKPLNGMETTSLAIALRHIIAMLDDERELVVTMSAQEGGMNATEKAQYIRHDAMLESKPEIEKEAQELVYAIRGGHSIGDTTYTYPLLSLQQAVDLIQSTFEHWYNERWQEEHKAMKSPPIEKEKQG